METPNPLAIIGSRDYPDLEAVKRFVFGLPEGAVIISGGARGVDQEAERAAKAKGFSIISYRPQQDGAGYRIKLYEWNPRGSTEGTVAFTDTFAGAAHMRNSFVVGRVVSEAGGLLAYWTGKKEHSGTYSVIQKAKAAGVLWKVVTW